MTLYIVYIDYVLENTAFEVGVNPIMNGISSALFKIPNDHVLNDNTLRETWEGKVNTSVVQIYANIFSLANQIFEGIITSITD